jgi:hypothetical protein
VVFCTFEVLHQYKEILFSMFEHLGVEAYHAVEQDGQTAIAQFA